MTFRMACAAANREFRRASTAHAPAVGDLGRGSDQAHWRGSRHAQSAGIVVSAKAGKKKGPLTGIVSGPLGVEPKGIEPSTSRMPFNVAKPLICRKSAPSRGYA